MVMTAGVYRNRPENATLRGSSGTIGVARNPGDRRGSRTRQSSGNRDDVNSGEFSYCPVSVLAASSQRLDCVVKLFLNSAIDAADIL